MRSGPGAAGRGGDPRLPGLTRAPLSPGRVIAPKKARIVQQQKLKKVSGACRARGMDLGGERGGSEMEYGASGEPGEESGTGGDWSLGAVRGKG